MTRVLTAICVFVSTFALSFAGDDTQPLKIYTTFYPTTYFASVIGGTHVNVVNPLPDGEDGAFWVPSREIVRAFQNADLIVVNGTNYETGFNKVSLPESRVVNATTFLKGSEIILQDPVTHSHGTAGMHTHQGMDGHTWVDPVTAKKECQVICNALCEKRPAFEPEFRANLETLNRKCDELDKMLNEKVVPLAKGKQLLSSHPAYNYLARTYQLQVKSFHLDPNEEPPKEELNLIEAYLKEHPASLMLWEDTPKPEYAAIFKKRFNIESVVYSPCEALEKEDAKAGKNFFDVMKENIDRLAKALGEK